MFDPTNQFPKGEGKLNIYFNVSENSGVGYYRQYLPAIKMRENGIANVMISDFKWGLGDHLEPQGEYLFDVVNWADIIVVGRKDDPKFYAQWGGIKEFFKVPIVVDTDDNIHNVRPHNPGYEGYHPGSPAEVWSRYAKVKVFDAVTVSTQDLKDFHSKENPRIYVLPNNLDMKEWDKYPKKEYNDGFIRIGFIGSAAHSDGIKMIKKSMVEILKKYPNVKLLLTSMYYPMFNDTEVKSQIESVPWIKLEEWPKGMKELGLDIGLAPLTDNLFNRGKSNLRWMEYSACGIPTIASAVKPYLCIENNKDGILVKEREEWFIALNKLIVDEQLRKQIGNNAYQRIQKEFDIDTNIQLWENIYREIHDKYHEFFGKKRVFKKVKKDKYKEVK